MLGEAGLFVAPCVDVLAGGLTFLVDGVSPMRMADLRDDAETQLASARQLGGVRWLWQHHPVLRVHKAVAGPQVHRARAER